MFKKKLLLLQNSFDNISTVVRRSRVSITPGESLYGSAVLNLFNTIFNKGSLVYSGDSDLELNIGSYVSGSRNINNGSSLEININSTSTPSLNISGATKFENVYSFNSAGFRDFSGHTSLSNIIDMFSTGFRNFSGKATLTNSHTLNSIPKLDIAGSTTNGVIVLLDSNGTLLGQQLGGLSLATSIDMLAHASLNINGAASFNNTHSFNATGSRDIHGRNTNGVVIILTGDGSTLADKIGYTTFSSIISLLCNGSLEYDGSASLNNTYTLGGIGNLNFDSSVNLNNSIILYPTGSLSIDGSVGKTLIIDLTSNGGTTAFRYGSTSLLVNNLLSATGGIEYSGLGNLSLNTGLSSVGNLEFDGSVDYVLQHLLSSLLSGNIQGQSGLNIDFDLLSSLTSQSFSIKELLFNLNILQTYTKSLQIDQSKTFNLRV